MEIIVNFGYRSYVFYSREDVSKAREIYLYCLELDDFERELELANIDFTYDLDIGDLLP